MEKLFEPNHDRFDGIRPINIYGMRFIYILMATFLAMDVWTYIITYNICSMELCMRKYIKPFN